jgi:hypothetical protein
MKNLLYKILAVICVIISFGVSSYLKGPTPTQRRAAQAQEERQRRMDDMFNRAIEASKPTPRPDPILEEHRRKNQQFLQGR